MGYLQVRYDSRDLIYDRRGFIRLATGSAEDRTWVATVKSSFEAVVYAIWGLLIRPYKWYICSYLDFEENDNLSLLCLC